jgi:hypothetical protein
MKYITLVLMLAFACSCTAPAKMDFEKDKAAFETSPVTKSFKSVADMNDAYFELKENNYFEFYRQLFDSIKNTRYPGKYEMKGDTFYLRFYDPAGDSVLGTKAVIKGADEQIVFFK